MATRTPMAGEKLSRVTVEKDTITRNDDGSVRHTWIRQTPDNLPCKFRHLGGAELVEARASYAGATLKIEMDRFPGLEPTLYRLQRYGNSGNEGALSILAVNDHEEQGQMLIVLCGEKLS